MSRTRIALVLLLFVAAHAAADATLLRGATYHDLEQGAWLRADGEAKLEFATDERGHLLRFVRFERNRYEGDPGGWSGPGESAYSLKDGTKRSDGTLSSARVLESDANPPFGRLIAANGSEFWNQDSRLAAGRTVLVNGVSPVVIGRHATLKQRAVAHTAPSVDGLPYPIDGSVYIASGPTVEVVARTERRAKIGESVDFWYLLVLDTGEPTGRKVLVWVVGATVDP